MTTIEQRFPMLSGPTVPWSAMAPHEATAQRNHQQSLQRLAERGGLDPGEAWCVVSGRVLKGTETKKDWEEYSAKWIEYAERINLHFAELEAAQQRIEKLEKILGINTPWPVTDVLLKLTNWCDHLAEVHNCDCHGHEERLAAVKAAKRLATEALENEKASSVDHQVTS